MKVIITPVEQDTLDIRSLRVPDSYIWDRAGVKRIVPAPIAGNAYQTWQAGETLLRAGLIESIPDEWCKIVWEACRPIVPTKPPSVQVNLRKHP